MDDLGCAPAAPFASRAMWALGIRTERYRTAQLALFGIASTAELARRRVAALELDGRLDSADLLIAVLATSMHAAWGAAASGVNLAALLATEVPVTEPKARRALAVVAVIGLGALTASSGRASSPARASTQWCVGTVLWALAGIAARRPTDPLLAALSTTAALTVWGRDRPR